MAWINQQYGLVQCPDIEVCKVWASWRTKVSAAMLESQKKRAFTAQDWFNAFNEVAQALEAIK
jgi:hypothetical protein